MKDYKLSEIRDMCAKIEACSLTHDCPFCTMFGECLFELHNIPMPYKWDIEEDNNGTDS